ncbi:Glycosyl hydrolases family 43 [Planctomycetes bacterium CA13]|uniref:Glycosyl hydrolases family 43 n=1 Tax=Novipirellula herctigrandis TaxID=2527986 RepID=A0A5C5ZCX1_9BACT|nr:Glycosyl hydrolases family 43 [Planctomycetes bacterium CA13]
MTRTSIILTLCIFAVTLSAQNPEAFPDKLPEHKPSWPLSAAMERFYDQWNGKGFEANELFSTFKYTPVTGLDYRNHDGTITRRDPSKVLKIDGTYYVWYTKRDSETSAVGPEQCSDTKPSADWDLCEIWYATSRDGFHWEEQGVAVKRPPAPTPGHRSVSTPDVLQWKGKYYLYYQGFVEAPYKSGGDFCPVMASVADSPDGPWKPADTIVVENGKPGQWDENAIHDPYPLIYKGKIYLYYKSRIQDRLHPARIEQSQGLAIAEHPFGPFEKHPLNPVLNSGHETGLFPWQGGIASMTSLNGPEVNTIQFALDGVNFEIASITEMMPIAPGPCVPDAFADNGDGRGITWGLCHMDVKNPGLKKHCMLARFDCDLSRDIHDRSFKRQATRYPAEVFFMHNLDQAMRNRVKKRSQDESNTTIHP